VEVKNKVSTKSFFLRFVASFLLSAIFIAGYYVVISELELRVTISRLAKLCDFEVETINARISNNRTDRSATWDIKYNTNHPINQSCSGTARPAWNDQTEEVLWRSKVLANNRKNPIHLIVGYSKFGRFSMCDTLECNFYIAIYEIGILVVTVIKH
jgi:hypothetical protein